MSPTPKTVFVLSSECTHVLPDEGLVLDGGAVTEIPAIHLGRVLQLAGVAETHPVKEQ